MFQLHTCHSEQNNAVTCVNYLEFIFLKNKYKISHSKTTHVVRRGQCGLVFYVVHSIRVNLFD